MGRTADTQIQQRPPELQVPRGRGGREGATGTLGTVQATFLCVYNFSGRKHLMFNVNQLINGLFRAQVRGQMKSKPGRRAVGTPPFPTHTRPEELAAFSRALWRRHREARPTPPCQDCRPSQGQGSARCRGAATGRSSSRDMAFALFLGTHLSALTISHRNARATAPNTLETE